MVYESSLEGVDEVGIDLEQAFDKILETVLDEFIESESNTIFSLDTFISFLQGRIFRANQTFIIACFLNFGSRDLNIFGSNIKEFSQQEGFRRYIDNFLMKNRKITSMLSQMPNSQIVAVQTKPYEDILHNEKRNLEILDYITPEDGYGKIIREAISIETILTHFRDKFSLREVLEELFWLHYRNLIRIDPPTSTESSSILDFLVSIILETEEPIS